MVSQTQGRRVEGGEPVAVVTVHMSLISIKPLKKYVGQDLVSHIEHLSFSWCRSLTSCTEGLR